MILAQLEQVYFPIFNSTLIKSLLPSVGLSNEAGMNTDCCGSRSCQDMKIHVSVFQWSEETILSQTKKKKKVKLILNGCSLSEKQTTSQTLKQGIKSKERNLLRCPPLLKDLSWNADIFSFDIKIMPKGWKEGMGMRGGRSQKERWNCLKAGTRLKACASSLTHEAVTGGWDSQKVNC